MSKLHKLLRRNNFFFKSKSFGISSTILYEESLDFYEILNVEDTASQSEIKKAYYKLAKIYHPDVKGDEKMFKNINLAYETLKNEEDKKTYDEIRKEVLNKRKKQYDSGMKNSFKNERTNRTKNEYQYYSTNTRKNKQYSERNYYDRMYKEYKEEFNKSNNSYQESFNKKKDQNNSYYEDLEREFEEFIKEQNETMKKFYRSSRKESQFEKFKINYKFSQYDPKYPKFVPTLKNRHHIENRKRQFYQAKEKEDKFKLPNELIKDKNFMDIYLRETDSDCYEKRITLRKIVSVYSKKTKIFFSLFLGFNIIFLLNK